MENSMLLENPSLVEEIKILLYISLPHMLVLGVLSLIARYTIRNSGESLKDYLQAIHLGGFDVLTGLLNRNSFETDTADFKGEKGEGTAVIYVDVNALHEINNVYGHDAGDDMLQYIAMCIKTCFGEENSYRIGGDEFAVLLRKNSETELREKIQKLRESTEKAGYSVSIGVAEKCFPCLMDDLLKEAEKEMYRDKKAYYEEHPERNRRELAVELPS